MNAEFLHHAAGCGQPRKCVLQWPEYRRRRIAWGPHGLDTIFNRAQLVITALDRSQIELWNDLAVSFRPLIAKLPEPLTQELTNGDHRYNVVSNTCRIRPSDCPTWINRHGACRYRHAGQSGFTGSFGRD
jgi:hypothetical protein